MGVVSNNIPLERRVVVFCYCSQKKNTNHFKTILVCMGSISSVKHGSFENMSHCLIIQSNGNTNCGEAN